jgi:hypothetical protein
MRAAAPSVIASSGAMNDRRPSFVLGMAVDT